MTSSLLFKFLATVAIASGSKFQMADEINVRKICSNYQCARSFYNIPIATFTTQIFLTFISSAIWNFDPDAIATVARNLKRRDEVMSEILEVKWQKSLR